jgi:hypothetical protein
LQKLDTEGSEKDASLLNYGVVYSRKKHYITRPILQLFESSNNQHCCQTGAFLKRLLGVNSHTLLYKLDRFIETEKFDSNYEMAKPTRESEYTYSKVIILNLLQFIFKKFVTGAPNK